MHTHQHRRHDAPHDPADHGPLPSIEPTRGKEARSLALTLGVTAAILVAEVIGGILTGSLALLADAGHMMTDLSAVGISLAAIRLATRPANLRKTFGYYRVEILAALANGLLLVGLSTFLFMEAYERFSHPPQIDTVPMIAVACIGLLANFVGLWLLAGSTDNLNVRGAFLHVLGDTVSSVAVVIGGIVMLMTGYYLIDPILTVVIGVIILVSAFNLMRASVDILLEAAPDHLEVEVVAHAIEHVGGVEAVHDLHIWTITSGMVALSAHVVVNAQYEVLASDRLLTEVKTMLLETFGIGHTTLQIESQVYEHVGAVH